MQVKKDEIREQIIQVAEKEFLKRGYNNASMRTIATKSHTTLGNLYNYFENKEAILDEVIGSTPEKIYQVLMEHDSASFPSNITKNELEEQFDDLANSYMSNLFPLELLLSNSLIILMEGCEKTKYESYRTSFTHLFQVHIANHLNVAPESFLAKSIAQGFLSSFLFISKNKNSITEGKSDLIQYIKTMTLGMPLPQKKKD